MAEPDPQQAERHQTLKNWEKREQRRALHADEIPGPLAPCRFRLPGNGAEIRVEAHLVQVFAEGFACLRSAGGPAAAAEGAAPLYWLVRDGLHWEEYLPRIVRCYRLGQPVPFGFRPLKKLSPDLVDHLALLTGPSLIPIFNRMREEGLLPKLRALSPETLPAPLVWASLRQGFQDFRKA